MAEDWIKGAIRHPGVLKAKAAKAGMSTRAYAEKHKDGDSTTAKQSRLAITLMGIKKRDSDPRSTGEKLYDKVKKS